MESSRSKKARNAKKRTVKRGKKPDNLDQIDNGIESDNDSIVSSSSTVLSDENDRNAAQAVDEIGDDIEQVLIDNLDSATAKSAKERQASLKEIKRVLSKKFISDFINDRKDTVLDISEKLLKRGQAGDKAAAAALGSLLCIQLGASSSLHVYQTLKPLLITVMNDPSQAMAARSSCASALGMCCFIGSEELEEVIECMKALRDLFTKAVKEISANGGVMSAAVLAWGLLLTVASESAQEEAIENTIDKLYRLLENGDLNLRLSTGEVIALIYETGRGIDDGFDGYVDGLHDLLKDLATDSSKFRAKREKKQQKLIFRDILKTVELGIAPSDTVKFGSEKVCLDSWIRIRQYNALKEYLGAGTTSHLQENFLLREIFHLGPPVIKQDLSSKETRWEKALHNAAAEKERTKIRSRGRENKRAAAAHGF